MRKTAFLLFAMLTLVSTFHSCTPPEFENDPTEETTERNDEQQTVGEKQGDEKDPDES